MALGTLSLLLANDVLLVIIVLLWMICISSEPVMLHLLLIFIVITMVCILCILHNIWSPSTFLEFINSHDLVHQKIDKTTKILAVLPNIIGSSGDCVNERQLIKSLQKYSNVITYSLIQVSNIGRLLNKSFLSAIKKDVNLRLLFPHIGYPYTIGLLLSLLYGFLISVLTVLEKPRIIYIRSSGLALFPLIFRSLHKAKVIVKIPSLPEEEFKGVGNIRVHQWDLRILKKILTIIDRYVICKADRIAVASPLFYYEVCKQRRAKNCKPPLIIPPGIDLNKIRKLQEISINEDKKEFIIGFIGLLEWWQGIDTLVEAIYVLQRNVDIKLKLLIVGDGPLKREIEKLCRKLNVCYEITGFIPHEDALKLMKRMDVLVVPRRRTITTETVMPIKVIEAWALGIPVIITKHEVLEYFENLTKKLVLSCEPTPQSVAHAIKLMMSNRRLVKELTTNGLMFAKKFDCNTIAERILKTIGGGHD